MKCAVVIKRNLSNSDEIAGLLAVLQQGCTELLLPAGWEHPGCGCWTGTLPAADLIAVLGGDGTLLEAVRLLAGRDIPVLGVNLGRIGFMVETAPDELAEDLRAFRDGAALIQDRQMLAINIPSQAEPVLVLNEVGLMPADYPSMLYLQTYVEGEYLSSFSGDGLLIATPTGSTGHSLSAGGAIMEPSLAAMLLTPICPRSLTVRPLVIRSDHTIEVTLKTPSTRCLIRLDGRVGGHLQESETLVVRKAEQNLRLLTSRTHSYFRLLHRKLGWGD